jgi:hypothetical protein
VDLEEAEAMTMLARPTCSSCRFWDQAHPEAPVGLCRIDPPVIVPLPGDPSGLDENDFFDGRWPVTDEVDWCGRHAWQETPRQPIAKDPGRGARARLNAVQGEVPTE